MSRVIVIIVAIIIVLAKGLSVALPRCPPVGLQLGAVALNVMHISSTVALATTISVIIMTRVAAAAAAAITMPTTAATTMGSNNDSVKHQIKQRGI